MIELVFFLVSLALIAGFVALTAFEERRGARVVLAAERTRLDERMARASFIAAHVDWTAVVRNSIGRAAHQIVHGGAHLSLRAVRAVERFLTRLVRHLRLRHAAEPAPGAEAREFVKTLSDFKIELQEARPEVPDVMSQ